VWRGPLLVNQLGSVAQWVAEQPGHPRLATWTVPDNFPREQGRPRQPSGWP